MVISMRKCLHDSFLRRRGGIRLKGEGIRMLHERVDFCNGRGGCWWCPVSRIGAGLAGTSSRGAAA
jgi:hypothetical protein